MRIIAHVDMDAFYAAVEERYNPTLRGRPIVIGADPKDGKGRGVVSTASYAARRYGIRSAMPISRAWRLADAARKRGEPETVFLRGNHALYREVSDRIMALLARGVDAFEEASIDEAYLDLSSLGDFPRAEAHVKALKSEVREREALTCSVGIGPNKLVAKIASDFRKPEGLTVVRPDEVQAFLDPLPVRVIPGIGPKTEAFLHEKGIRTVAELRAVAPAQLTEWFGKWGEDLSGKARGISESPVTKEWEPKSVGEQETFEEDTLEARFILERARELAASVRERLLAEGFRAFRTTTVTVRFADFVTMSRSRTVAMPLTTREELEREALRLLLPFLDARENPRRKKIRLIGVRAEKLLREPISPAVQEPIAFDQERSAE
ncbi:MAG: DNA polymerase IV [Candidatus Rokubacteria bacterium]|nr:DNA polymerase IV [Candidatus Rokubacteria bacterium]